MPDHSTGLPFDHAKPAAGPPAEDTDASLGMVPRPVFHQAADPRGRPFVIPDRLPRLPRSRALARVTLPLHLSWSDPERGYDLAKRRERLRVYEIVLREGTPGDVLAYIDGALLADAWPDLVLPASVRNAWEHLVTDR